MDRRKKRTSTSQYMMYIELMEKDSIFASGRVPRDVDSNYMHNKWKELSDKLNTCGSGPRLTTEEWRKRLNDWKNTTRCKYRRSLLGEKDITMTSLEMKALELFGKVPNLSTETLSIHLKSEKEDPDEEMEQQRTSESIQKELQAAVEEAIGGDDDDEGLEELQEEHESEHVNTITNNAQTAISTVNSSGGANGGGTTTYRTIVVENAGYADDDNDNDDHLEYITHRRHTLGPSTSATVVATGVQTLITNSPTTTVTKLINGEIPLKRLRSHASEQIIYEVKKAPIQHQQPTTTHRNITIHNSAAPSNIIHQQHSQTLPVESSNNCTTLSGTVLTTQDTREVARQLKRIADIKAEKLKFEIARFKFNNPGFHFNQPQL